MSPDTPTAKFGVLIVEDDEKYQARAVSMLSPHAKVLTASSIRQAVEHIEESVVLTHVILDGYVPHFAKEKHRLTTTHDIIFFLQEYHPAAKIYTASSDNGLNEEFAKIGCIRSTKELAPHDVLKDIKSDQPQG